MFFFCVSLDNAASEGVLASFFNSLLSKKTGSPGSPSAGGVQSTAKKSGRSLIRTVLRGEWMAVVVSASLQASMF